MPDVLGLNLDDVNKTAFCIPYNPHDAKKSNALLPASPYKDRDLENGCEMRFQAYKVAWKKCLDRVQEIIRELQSASVNSVVNEVKTSYLNPLPGLPYTELPVVSIISNGAQLLSKLSELTPLPDPSLGTSFLTNIMPFLESEESVGLTDEQVDCSVIHLYPGDFPNIMTGMRAIVTAFLDKAKLERGRHKSATSLASYDIRLFIAWYRAWTKDTGNRPNLVLVLHDFEQFDPSVMQDVFHIFSTHVKELPIVFLLSMSSPSTNHLNDAYPRATMALLRVRKFVAPSGTGILHEVLSKTFFDPDFEPDVMIGPDILECLQDHFMRHHSSVDVILTSLQLVHLRHFSLEPLTILVNETPSFATLSDGNSFAFVNSIATRLLLPFANADLKDIGQFTSTEILSVIKKVDEARQTYRSYFTDIRIAFDLMVRIQTFLQNQGYKGLDWSSDKKPGLGSRSRNLLKPMLNVISGNAQKDVKDLSLLTKKLKRSELQDLLQILHDFHNDMPNGRRVLGDRSKIVNWKTQLRSITDDDTERLLEITVTFSKWLMDYLSSKVIPLDDCALWDVWYTGQTPFSSELLNPSIRASMVAGLLRPHDFAIDITVSSKEFPPEKAIWELPDTSILFKRYLDSGKMINVYDWFESFKTVLDTQHEKLQEQETQDPVTPQKRRGPKPKKKPTVTEKPQARSEEDEEKWNLEVQARFVRAMHELDYLGFIKHTGRKADHVLRTHFDIGEVE